ncbi:hypothetical protein EON81_02335 [bacterium]|nr:MAG: hypothetical protein EON81_02335 [bacterium]
MIPHRIPPRIHLLPAKESAVCVVIARVRTQIWHVMRWDLRSGELEHGSWFRGTLEPFRSDVSWNGEFMLYSAFNYARPYEEATWIGLCRPPWLKTIAHASTGGAWFGGGLFNSKETISWRTSESLTVTGDHPFKFRFPRLSNPREFRIEALEHRLERDGWTFRFLENAAWSRPSKEHPKLWLKYSRHESHPPVFSLEGYPGIITEATEWAAWDCDGFLLWTEKGWLYRTSLEELRRSEAPGWRYDLNSLEPP